tara:strand:+ start:863 stop:1351 length:489 start_codon:yes stop_codon:yes gene_type:complete
MKYSFKFYKNSAYLVLVVLLFFFLIASMTSKSYIVEKLNFNDIINLNSNKMKEPFNNNGKFKYSKISKDDSVIKMIERKLKSLTEEIGGNEGKNEVKQILKNSQKICNLECAKCMMNMIDSNKGMKSIDFDKIFEDDTNEDCIKCKKYTELSNSIQTMINNF